MARRLELGIVDCITGRKSGPLASTIRWVLRVGSAPYSVVVRLRNWFYNRGLFRVSKASVPVISVGSLAAGGTGKTPIALMLAEHLANSVKVGILNRGYRSPAEKAKEPTLVSDGEKVHVGPEQCGDEASLFAQRLPKAIVVTGADRVAGAAVVAELGAEVIILDDGFQHRKLHRNLDVVVLDAMEPLSTGWCLPGGILREPVGGLDRADLVVLNRTGSLGAAAFERAAEAIAHYTGAGVVGMDFEVAGVYDADHIKRESIASSRAAVYSSIANPGQFRKTIENLGAEVVAELRTADHTGVSAAKLLKFTKRAMKKGASVIVCTEKDWVRFESIPELPIPLLYVKVLPVITHRRSAWDQFVKAAIRLT